MPNPIVLSNGVKLRDPEDFDTLRTNIFESAKNRLIKSFPTSYNNVRLELADVDYVDPDNYTIQEQKEAIMKDKFLSRRLRGVIRLIDEKDNSLIEEKPLTLMRVPYLTERGTFIYNGNEYSHATQARMMYGAYTRRQNNGDLETQFQVKPGTGSSFRVGFEPESAQYRLKVGTSKLHLYSLLSDIGVDDNHLEKLWGPAVLEKNKNNYDARVFEKAYQNLVSKREQSTDYDREFKAQQIKNALDKTLLHEETVKSTLPGLLSEKNASIVREVNNAKIEEAESIQFKPDLSPADLQDEYNCLYGKMGPRLAGMDVWPERWFPEGSNTLGWLDWYFNYYSGTRTFDDERQIMRWKLFKSRTVNKFVKNPTPRAAFSLRLWGIDPLKLISDLDKRRKLHADMQDYKAKAEIKYAEKNVDNQVKKSFTEQPLPEVNYENQKEICSEFSEQLINSIKMSSARGSKEIVAVIDPVDLMSTISDLNIKIANCGCAELGSPTDARVSIAIGIPTDLPNEIIQEAVKYLGKRKGPAIINPAFFDSDNGLTLDSPDLEDLFYGLRNLFGDLIKSEKDIFSPNIRLKCSNPIDGFEYNNPPIMKVTELRLVEPEAETILINYV
jgi:DNA-directed RNA polymerase beta subunit